MLSQEERRRLDQMERQLHCEDPGFMARMSGAPVRRVPRLPVAMCVLIWLVAPVLAATGRWPGAVAVAVIAAVTTAAVLRLARSPRRAGSGAHPRW